MAGKRAYRLSVCDATLESRLVLSHAGVSAEVAHEVHAAAKQVLVEHATANREAAAERAAARRAAARRAAEKLAVAKHLAAELAAARRAASRHGHGNTAGNGETGTTGTGSTPVFTPPSNPPNPSVNVTTPSNPPNPPVNVTTPNDPPNTPAPDPSPPPPAPTSGPVQGLTLGGMSAAQFNSLFKPTSTGPAMTAALRYLGAPISGTIASQVFQGSGAAAGLYAYAYQVTAANVNDASGQPVSVQGLSWHAVDTPVGTNLTGAGSDYAYVISDGPVGDLAAPQAAPGQGVVGPSSITWQAGPTSGSVAVSFANPGAGVAGLSAGGTSATFVLISRVALPQDQFATVQSANPNDLDALTPVVYTPLPGVIVPIATNNNS